MIVHTPEIESGYKAVSIFTRIEQEGSIPSILWYRFPAEYKHYISPLSDGFVVSLLLLAMSRREDIHVKGAMSLAFFEKLDAYQKVFKAWFPKKLDIIQVQCEHLEHDPGKYPQKSASAFSGGVDSFFTLWSHLPENEKDEKYHMAYSLFVHGFDIPLGDVETYKIAKEAYGALLKRMNVTLIPVSTNIREHTRNVSWEISHGSALIGTALFLRNLFSRFYIPSSDPYHNLIPWGSHPDADTALSTRGMEIIHDGAYFSRFQKIAEISDWPLTYSALRVCWEKPHGLQNCCKCEKCIRTMMALEGFNKLERYQTFPQKLKGKYIRKCMTYYSSTYNEYIDIKNFLLKINNKSLLYNLYYTLVKMKLFQIINKPNPLKGRKVLSRLWDLFILKIHKAKNYCKRHGLGRLFLNFLELRGIVFRKEFLFFEKRVDGDISHHHNEKESGFHFVKTRIEDIIDMEFPDSTEWITGNEALRRWGTTDCAFFALTKESTIICYLIIAFNDIYIPSLGLRQHIDDETAYTALVYTRTGYREKGFAANLNLWVQQYLKRHGYGRYFMLIEPENTASQKTHKKAGMINYQSVVYRRFLFLKYYRVNDEATKKFKRFWSIRSADRDMWKAFSKIIEK